MSDQFLGEIRLFAGDFAPVGWALCNGQLLAISQSSALFSLLGVAYGGNGTSNFGLPNLQAAIPIGQGNGPGLTPRVRGESGGEKTVTLITSEMPQHNHMIQGSTEDGKLKVPATTLFLGRSASGNLYQSTTTGALVQLDPRDLTNTGGGLAHQNMQPYLTLCYIIALQGIFPQRP